MRKKKWKWDEAFEAFEIRKKKNEKVKKKLNFLSSYQSKMKRNPFFWLIGGNMKRKIGFCLFWKERKWLPTQLPSLTFESFCHVTYLWKKRRKKKEIEQLFWLNMSHKWPTSKSALTIAELFLFHSFSFSKQESLCNKHIQKGYRFGHFLLFLVHSSLKKKRLNETFVLAFLNSKHQKRMPSFFFSTNIRTHLNPRSTIPKNNLHIYITDDNKGKYTPDLLSTLLGGASTKACHGTNHNPRKISALLLLQEQTFNNPSCHEYQPQPYNNPLKTVRSFLSGQSRVRSDKSDKQAPLFSHKKAAENNLGNPSS